MTQRIPTVALLIAALVCYAFGLEGGGNALMLVGAGLELWFWKRIVPGWGMLSRKPRR